MNILELTDEQLRLVQKALDLYSRIGIGQFNHISEHPTFDKILYTDELKKDYHSNIEVANIHLNNARNILCQMKPGTKTNTSFGIYAKDIDSSCRMAYDIVQVIRHEFWKRNPDRSSITVDSDILFSYEDDNSSNNIKCKKK